MEKITFIAIGYVLIAYLVALSIVTNSGVTKGDDDFYITVIMSVFIGMFWPIALLAIIAFSIVDGVEYLLSKIFKK